MELSKEEFEATKKLMQEVFLNKAGDKLQEGATKVNFGADLGQLAFTNCFASIWLRPGLDRKSRSLVTLGILIALRASDQLKMHFVSAVKNGCTITELEEVIYTATAYAGFPTAVAAHRAAIEGLLAEGMIQPEEMTRQPWDKKS